MNWVWVVRGWLCSAAEVGFSPLPTAVVLGFELEGFVGAGGCCNPSVWAVGVCVRNAKAPSPFAFVFACFAGEVEERASRF